MSSDNAQSAVTYTSISSNLDGPSRGIPLMNAGEFPKMDPYEKVAQQGQVPPLSPAYVPDPMELDKHVPIYVSKPEHPEYHAPLDDDIQVEDQPHTDDTSPTAERFLFTAPPLGCDVAESSAAASARAPRGQCDFVDTVEAGQGLIRSLGHDGGTIARAANIAEDVGYVRALQAFNHRMMTSIEEVNLRISYQA
nr:hypothetical protein [Tanacetum cinerariifolium]